MAALDPARDDRPRPTRRSRRPDQPVPARQRADPLDLQRDPATGHRADHRTHTRSRLPPRLVTLASPTPVPRQDQPLPAPRVRATDDITIYGCSTSTATVTTTVCDNVQRAIGRRRSRRGRKPLWRYRTVGSFAAAGPEPHAGFCA